MMGWLWDGWDGYGNIAQEDRDGIRKAKAQLGLNLVRDMKNNKKSFQQVHKTSKNGKRNCKALYE